MRSVLLWGITFYRLALSPLKPPCCRFVPTCSEYALEAVGRFGALRGGLLALWRLARCHPFARGGYDPVPDAPWPRPKSTAHETPDPRLHSYRRDLKDNGKQTRNSGRGALPCRISGLELPVPGQTPGS
ncbi:membrane protein insertion efficiency factor YidD [Solidesulfovibrio sp.]|uniref:membrane protein insertion efficiency factor YidD n=1 Tax=Solidesulfovibrio sp. TaxID=2910990 RepID=UPI002B2111AD|nr:membrane protein insertion efficiency factor YidD [Solidesulfovibrio sp.]MEA5089473.1 membrane protein insertion efficiency factor YidD [Solidesulfovibrio sp.]